AHTPHALDEPHEPRILRLHLEAEPVDRRLEQLPTADELRIVPAEEEEGAERQHLARMLQERSKQSHLMPSELDPSVLDERPRPTQVERERAVLEDSCAAQRAADESGGAQCELARMERLRDIVGGAGFQA